MPRRGVILQRNFSDFDDYDEYQAYLKDRRRESSKAGIKKRLELEKLLQSEISLNRRYLVIEKYGNRCLITGEENDVEIDHFIPLSWGRVGSVWGNLYPISKKINNEMRTKNPFVWIWGDSYECPYIDWIKWKKFIELIAKENMLTVDELVDFTFWCENNKRTATDIVSDGVENKSIDIWRKELNGKSFTTYNFFLIRIRQEEVKENKIIDEFRSGLLNGYWDKYHPVYQKMKEIGKINFRKKGKYSTKFKKLTGFGEYWFTTKDGTGIEIEEWSEISGISIETILNYLQTTENRYGYKFGRIEDKT